MAVMKEPPASELAVVATTTANLPEITLSKVGVAKIQLDSAIVAYFERRLVEAITLAGAAEEIFGNMLRSRQVKPAVERIADLSIMQLISESRKHRIAYINLTRNALKHAGDDIDEIFSITEVEAFIMIVRAIGNTHLLGLEDTLEVGRFWRMYQSKIGES